MKYFRNVLETIGNTPLIQLNKVCKDIPATVLAKVETYNPGHSIKDRMALKMVEVAEKEGKLKPGGTIIECTSGNTGMGLALAAVVKGYKCIFTTSDKQSREKFDILKALGAEVIVCPTNVEASDPRSYYSVAEKLSKEIPNSFWFNQYDNMANTLGHYESTGPELWRQTEGKITHLVATVGTGGTISGTGKYLKEQNPDIQILGVDVYGSVLKKYHETGEFDESEIYPYITEGVGEDIIPKNVAFDVIDFFEKVNDKEGAVMARRLAREEGLLMGYSAGTAVAGLLKMKDRFKPEDVVVVIFHDHGSRYVGKIYNDEWMRERGFLDEKITAANILDAQKNKELVSIEPNDTLARALQLIKNHELSQLPVIENGEVMGTILEDQMIELVLNCGNKPESVQVHSCMGKALPIIGRDATLQEISRRIDKSSPAVLVQEEDRKYRIITQYDLLKYLY
jgi:cystathionine beta-synthase